MAAPTQAAASTGRALVGRLLTTLAVVLHQAQAHAYPPLTRVPLEADTVTIFRKTTSTLKASATRLGGAEGATSPALQLWVVAAAGGGSTAVAAAANPPGKAFSAPPVAAAALLLRQALPHPLPPALLAALCSAQASTAPFGSCAYQARCLRAQSA